MVNIAKELHKRVVRKFPRRQVNVSGVNNTWSIDLVDMQKLAKENKGFKYILTCIDVLSKFAWVVPLKNKKYHTLINAFQEILKTAQTAPAPPGGSTRLTPKYIWSDQGSEFTNKEMTRFLEPIKVYHTFSEHKASPIERFNRTLKNRMWYKMTKHETKNWIGRLPKIVNLYNHTIHNTTGMKPYKAIKHEKTLLKLQRQRSKKLPSSKPKLSIGDIVRLAVTKGSFSKGYEANWSKELFRIAGIIYSKPVTYEVEDLNNEPVKGSFYEQELQKSNAKV